MITAECDVGRTRSQLAQASQALKDSWWKEYERQAFSILQREQARHFAAQSGPNGEPWAPLSPLSLELSAGLASQKVGGARSFRRSKSGAWIARGPGGAQGQRTATVRRSAGSRLLLDNGTLRASVTGGSSRGMIRRAQAGHWIEFGTNLPYAARQQFGGRWPVTRRQRAYLSSLLGRWFAGKTITTPARPFLGVGEAGKRDLTNAAAAVANRLLLQATK